MGPYAALTISEDDIRQPRIDAQAAHRRELHFHLAHAGGVTGASKPWTRLSKSADICLP